MSIDIIVQRGTADHPGDDITEPLAATLPAALSLGRAELDDQAHKLQDVDMETVYRDGVTGGQMVDVRDELQGAIWYGKISGVSHDFDGPEITTSLSIKKLVEL